MSRKDLYENKLQMDYFSDDYIRFEEDFQKYYSMDVPLTFLIDDILQTMALNQKNYFKMNKENAKDGKEHYFYFKITLSENRLVRNFKYCFAVNSKIEKHFKIVRHFRSQENCKIQFKGDDLEQVYSDLVKETGRALLQDRTDGSLKDSVERIEQIKKLEKQAQRLKKQMYAEKSMRKQMEVKKALLIKEEKYSVCQ